MAEQKQKQHVAPGKQLRTVTVTRGYVGDKELDDKVITNQPEDAVHVPIYLDGVKQGILSRDHPVVTFSVDCAAHRLSFNMLSVDATLPAGQDSYSAIFLNDGFRIGIVGDDFQRKLAEYILSFVRGQEFRDRICHPNNFSGAVEIALREEYILVYYYVQEAQGIYQWYPVYSKEKIYYSSIGMMPPPREKQPSGYWSYMEMFIRNMILEDNEANLVHIPSGFAIWK